MKNKILLSLCFIIGTSYPVITVADMKAEDAIKFRQSAMMFMRWNMGKIKKQVVKKPETYNKQQVIDAANVISAIANSGLGALFPSNTEKGKGWKETKIKPDFFEQPEEVKKRATKFNKEANKLAEIANSGNVSHIAEQFDATLKACKGCHKKFRKKNKKKN